jgi:hypothetical protein
MQPSSPEPRECQVCGSPLQPDHLFCPNCGTRVASGPSAKEEGHDVQTYRADPQPGPDPSTLDTREFDTFPSTEHSKPPAADPEYNPAYQDTGQPTWGTPETAVAAEQGNRTLWIILGIVAFIVLVCCCILPLGLMAVANWDTAFQEELRSVGALVRA